MNTRATFSGFLFLAALLSAPAAYALDGEFGGADAGRISFGPRAVWFEPEDADDSQFFGGGQLRFHLTKTFAIEGSADYRRSDFGATNVHVYPVQASLLAYFLPTKYVSPFILGGAGWYFTTVEGPGNLDETQNRFGPHAGAGLQFFMGPLWSIDTTYRYTWVEDIESRDASLINRDFSDRGHMVTVGLNYHFPVR